MLNILLVIQILAELIVVIRLLILARRNNLPNVYWLAATYFAAALGLVFAPTEGNPFGGLPISVWIFTIVEFVMTQMLTLGFTQATFYRDRKSPLWWYVGLCTILTVMAVYGLFLSESNYNQNPWVASACAGLALALIWHGWCAYRALADLSKEQAVEDWVKARYRLIVFYSAMVVIGQIGNVIRTVFVGGSTVNPLGNAMGLLSLTAQFATLFAEALAWIMPEGYRRWLNRNYQPPVQEESELALSEEEIMRQLRA